MFVMLLITNNWVMAFGGILLALVGFFLTHQAAKCPNCSAGLLEGGTPLSGVTNLLLLTAAKADLMPFVRLRKRGRRLRLTE